MKPIDSRIRTSLAASSRATISDVAREAGVSKTSVSRFLNGEQSTLSPGLRRRIDSAIQQLGYQPSQLARSLKGGRTRLIGFVVADIENPYSVAVLHGAEAACREQGYTLVVCNTGGDRALERRTLAALTSYNVEGLILNTAGWPEGLPPDVTASDVPIVLIDRRLPGHAFDFVGLDNAAMTGLAVQHLTDRGFGHLGFFAQNLAGVSARLERAAAFCAAAARTEGCVGEVHELGDADPAAVDGALKAFLAAGRGRPVAVLAASGLVTLRIVQSAARLRLRIPEDFGLVGFDELEWSALVPPGITTIEQPTKDIGASAVRGLLRRLAGDASPAQDVIFLGRIVERGSSRRPECPGTAISPADERAARP
ncbi:LacI family DNA-binding transcriptional regulator [Roseicella aquatilis]|uniref:LacI family DNA-binding transcriptional regulator n=1 Tax=Roseicella aquatilis TaxID=2527868 RepID=A0A4R4DSM3_9PROT|nr:LacI family DNA-binding transcriptional regulator [Roseicella aquatilis]TCZ64786.1 LacI family DNA-binding transcriptional regulator [Roseicella aquatilis]